MGKGESKSTTVMEKDILELLEYNSLYLNKENFSEENAEYVYRNHKAKIEIVWPNPTNLHKWKLSSQGWVGYIPISETLGINLKPKTSIENLFGMLEYAYDLKSFELLDNKFKSDSITDFFERLVVILTERILLRMQQGLYKAYVLESSTLPYVRGRINTNKLYQTMINPLINCQYEEHTFDIEENQIIMWTLYLILRSGLLKTEKVKKLISKVERTLHNYVSIVSFKSDSCIDRTYNRLNYDYEILHKLCRFFLDNLGPTHELGERDMLPFLIKMQSLFEKFIGKWVSKKIDRTKYSLKLQESFELGESSQLKMRPDMILFDVQKNIPVCVLDMKYKIGETVSNEDYNQMIAYADALGCENAILIYPQHLKSPFNVKVKNIRVQSLVFNLGLPIDEGGEIFLRELYRSLNYSSIL